MSRRSGLGRGLAAIIPTDGGGQKHDSLRELAVGTISPNPSQPRAHFDEEALADLSASIRELGVLQPILVKELSADTYELIAGERRWRAAKRAGLATIPALIRSPDSKGSLEQALVENIQRADLNALEEAGAYSQLAEQFGLTHEEVAKRVGKNRVTVTNTLRLLQLPPTIQKLVATGRLPGTHARALLATPDRAFAEELAQRAVAQGLTVKAIEEAIRARAESPGGGDAPQGGVGGPAIRRLREPGVVELETLLADHLETRVKVAMKRHGGQIQIEFADLDDLERIYTRMAQPAHDA